MEWAIDGLRIATVSGAALPGSNISIGYWDSFASLSDNTNLSFGVFDNVRVERLTSNAPPYITSQPLSQMVKAGSNATFVVTAGGVPAPGYQWRLDGAPIAGATASSYTRLGVQTSDAGDYSVVVTNAGGTVTSADALLTVSPPLPPRFDLISMLPDNRIRFVLSGEAGNYLIETSADLSGWSDFTNLNIVSGAVEFVDDSSTNAPQRFYRAKPGS